MSTCEPLTTLVRRLEHRARSQRRTAQLRCCRPRLGINLSGVLGASLCIMALVPHQAVVDPIYLPFLRALEHIPADALSIGDAFFAIRVLKGKQPTKEINEVRLTRRARGRGQGKSQSRQNLLQKMRLRRAAANFSSHDGSIDGSSSVRDERWSELEARLRECIHQFRRRASRRARMARSAHRRALLTQQPAASSTVYVRVMLGTSNSTRDSSTVRAAPLVYSHNHTPLHAFIALTC